MSDLNSSMRACGVFLLCAMSTVALSAQTFTTLHSFNGTDGSQPIAALVQGTDSNFYGTTSLGGTNSGKSCGKTTCGTVFQITSSGTLTTLHSFDGADGFEPQGALVQTANGTFYGTTTYGGTGTNPVGTVFTITQSGNFTSLHTFDYTHGAAPYAGLIQATNGMFYGTTPNGGADSSGTIFKITPSGKLTTLQSLCCTGTAPVAPLVQSTHGKLYGTALYNGTYSCGTVFKITLRGTLTALHDFKGKEGCFPWAGLIQATDGNFYGTTTAGGTGYGNVFKITPNGTVTSLYSFNKTDGDGPTGALVQAADGTLLWHNSRGWS